MPAFLDLVLHRCYRGAMTMKMLRTKVPVELAAALTKRAAEETDGNESMIVRRALRVYLAAEVGK